MRRRLLPLAALLFLLLASLTLLRQPALAGAPAAEPAYSIYHVFPGQSIQFAIDHSVPGDTVLVHAGTYTEHITMTSRISLHGMGWDQTIITGAMVSNTSVIHIGQGITSATVISGIQVTRGHNAWGGGIHIYASSPLIKNTWVNNCYASYGGGIYVNGGRPTFDNVPVWNNHAAWDGGGFYLSTGLPVTITSPSMFGTYGTLLFNTAGRDGGAIHAHFGGVNLERLRMAGNSAAAHGGAVSIVSPTSPVTVAHSVIGNQDILGVAFGGNVAEYGGGLNIQDAARVNIEKNIIQGNVGHQAGGGIRAEDSPGRIWDNFFLQNGSDAGPGGGLHLSGEHAVTISLNWVEGNTATWGGGLYATNSAGSVFDRNGFFGNSASVGGGMALSHAGVVTVTNNLIARNLATTPSRMGAGVYIDYSAVRLVNNTIADNMGDGVYFAAAEGTRIVNNIIVNNHDGSLGSGIKSYLPEPTTDYQTLYNDVWGNVGAGDYTNVDNGTGNLSLNPGLMQEGGLFAYYHLRPTSPLKAAGAPAWAPPFDVDGQPRGTLGTVSMGADEVVYLSYLPLARRQ